MVFYIIIWDHLKFENSLVNNELEYGTKSSLSMKSLVFVIIPIEPIGFFLLHSAIVIY